MKKALAILGLAIGTLALPLPAQIKGCTSDVRTGVCNKVCSTKHVIGCTLDQLDPLLKTQSMNCLTTAANRGLPKEEFQGKIDKCTGAIDREIEEWKKAHPKK
jgi:hypothetical protein